jgi:hypothetical protein
MAESAGGGMVELIEGGMAEPAEGRMVEPADGMAERVSDSGLEVRKSITSLSGKPSKSVQAGEENSRAVWKEVGELCISEVLLFISISMFRSPL